MNRIVFKKTDAQDRWNNPEPLTWWLVKSDGKDVPIVVCENGHWAYLNHDVDAEGNVNPSLVCAEEWCSFHVWGQLEGWNSK